MLSFSSVFKDFSADPKIPAPCGNHDDLGVEMTASRPAQQPDTAHTISIISFPFSRNHVC